MRTPRRKQASAHDLARLEEAQRILVSLCTHLYPASEHYRAVANASDAVRVCAVVWTGDERAFAAKIGSTPVRSSSSETDQSAPGTK